MTHDHVSDKRKTRRLSDSQQFGWHPDAPTPTDYEQKTADVSSNDATPASFNGPSLLGDSPADAPAYWTPGQPGELPPTIIQRKAPPNGQELLAKYSKPAMMALTVAAVSSAGLAQNTQNTLAQANNSADTGESPHVQAADTEQQPQLFQLLGDTDEDVRTAAAGNGSDRTAPFLYTVERGDWVRHIARDFGLQTMTIVWNNNLPDPDFILPGQQLLILPVDGVMIEVQPGDTLNSVATHYGVSATAIINYEPNEITNPDMIQPGQVLIVPGGAPPASATVSGSTTESGATTTSNAGTATQESTSEPEPVQESAPAPQADPEPVEEQSASFNGASETVVVESGDTLAEIASRHGVSVDEMASLNGLSNVDVIQPGDELYLPDGVEAQPAPDPEPQPDPEPEPEPEPQPDPEPTPATQPVPAPEPEPEPTATPAPAPTATPEPEPTATPAPAPTATPEPEPTAAPEPPAQSSGPPSGIEAQLEYYANQYGLDPNLIKAVAWRESGWNQNAISSAGAIGVMQVMPGTATWINNNLVSRNLDVRGSTADNIEAGTAYLAHRIEQFGDVERGLAAYYMGPATVQNHGITATGRQYVDRILETRDYFAANGGPPNWR